MGDTTKLNISLELPSVEKAVDYIGEIVERNHIGEAIKAVNGIVARRVKGDLRKVDVKGR